MLGPETRTRKSPLCRHPRCPACLDSILPQEKTLLCPDGHAAIHAVCRSLLTVCPVIGCEQKLRVSISSSRKIESCEGSRGPSSEWRSLHFEFLEIERGGREVDRWRRYSRNVGCFFGAFCVIFPPFLLILVPALIGFRREWVREEELLENNIRAFGGLEAVQRYWLERRRAESRTPGLRTARVH